MAKNKYRFYPIVTLGVLLILWEGIVGAFSVPQYILPAPLEIGEALVKDYSLILHHTGATLLEAFVGFGIAVVLSFALAITMDLWRPVKEAIYPLLVISQTIPTIAIAPLLIIWFGFGYLPKIILVIMVCFFPIVISLMDGFDQVDRDYLNLFQVMKANKVQTYVHLKLPYAMVNFFSGLKIAATYMLMAAVIGEWLGGDRGIGVYMVRAKSAYALDKVFASIFVIVVVSLILIYIIKILEKKVINWK